MPENEWAWGFFQEVLFWSGGGFDEEGILDVGHLADGFKIVLSFQDYRMTETERDVFYNQLRDIMSAVRNANGAKMEELKRGNKA